MSTTSNQPIPNPTGPSPPLVRLVVKPDRGRSLVASGPIKPGQVVLVDSPLILYPSSLASLPLCCSRCFRVLPSQPFPCPSCHVALFCSPKCLSLSHPHLLCHALPSLVSGNDTWPDDLLFLLSAYSLPSNSLLQLLSLHSNSRYPDEQMPLIHSQLSSFIPPNLVPTHFSPETTSSLLSKKKTNSVLRGGRALGFYLWASMINHDCLPNVCRFGNIDDPTRENNTDLIFRALHEIKEGSEICRSYVVRSDEYRERHSWLIEYYGFRCKCDRCKIESKWFGNEGEYADEEEELVEREVNFPHWDLLMRYTCKCDGTLAPLPPYPDGSVSDIMECNWCGIIRKYEPPDDDPF
ncbi:Histone-lysine N-methyltransferase ASHR2 [Rhynchospora pubera]|uniref:Histone-lysine N-methyltransferase ASHR2 n=1 Tax=Rhynchospora pubera TaxID=906938 RepID=A0AAV8AT44_9POAL|nr:Histone-lysine N-methyltransferase ASHR2 [Rhynchospora pubera]KAJ4798587.1 Histone-lysine N-methyltransferase ASHR2 [Rhynchospora pubera]